MKIKEKIGSLFKNWYAPTKIVSRAKSDSKKKEDYKINEKILFDYYRTDYLIRRGINTLVNKMFSDGYRINPKEYTTDADSQIKKAKEFMDSTSYIKHLKNETRLAFICGNGYHEIDKITPEVYNLNPTQIKKEIDKQNGEVSNYTQTIDGKKVADIDPNRVIHYTIEELGDDSYGVGLVESILYVSAIKKFAERNLGKRFEREKLRGFWLFKGLSDDDFDEMTKVITECKDDPQRDIYLKGGSESEVIYQDLIKGDDMQFNNLLNYLRQAQVIGLMLHPINVGIPEGTNKSTSQEENKDLDEAIAGFQSSIENIVTKRLFNDILGLDKIEFELVSVNKRDTFRETEIAEKLNRLPTSVNEIREELGYPLIEEDWAYEIRKTGAVQPNPFNNFEENSEENLKEDEEIQDEDKKKVMKSMQKKKTENFPKESPIKKRDEREFYSILSNWVNKIQKDVLDELKAHKHEFKKQINDPEEFIKKVLAKNNPDLLRKDIDEMVKKLFQKGHQKAEMDLKKRINLNTDKLVLLDKYTFDLVKGLNEDMKNKLQQVLRRGILDNSNLTDISKQIKENLQVSLNRAETIARTETNRLANEGRLESYKQAGIKKVRWIASIDERTSEICQELNGQIIDLSKGEIFKSSDWSGQSPPAHVNCRSSIILAD